MDKSYHTQFINEAKNEIINALNFSKEVDRYRTNAVGNLSNGMYFSNIDSLQEGLNKINKNLSNELDKIQTVLENILNNQLKINSGNINKVLD